MSQKPGRQSPSPERQTDSQIGDASAGGKAQSRTVPQKAERAQDTRKEQTKGLTSNPEGPLEKVAKWKVGKDVGDYYRC